MTSPLTREQTLDLAERLDELVLQIQDGRLTASASTASMLLGARVGLLAAIGHVKLGGADPAEIFQSGHDTVAGAT